jgi:hypothetical protein
MRRLIWILGWIVVAIWSLVAWGSYGLLNVFGDIAARNADLVTNVPEAVEWLAFAVTSLQGLGLAAIVVVWAIVSLLILAVSAVLARIVGMASRPDLPRHDVPYRAPPPPPQPRTGPPSDVQDLMRRIERR